ncbi:MAG: hypothetical protein E6R13_05700 [Spirochaetes bacterium]|nr:MAG: hypothetical protein E6R13_05700 [Spirochaetota bacterium]
MTLNSSDLTKILKELLNSDLPKKERHLLNYDDLSAVAKSPMSYWINLNRKEVITPAKERELKLSEATKLALSNPFKFFENVIIMPDFGDGRTKEAKEKKLEWLLANKNKEHLIQEEYDKIKNISIVFNSLPEKFKINNYVEESRIDLEDSFKLEVPSHFKNNTSLMNVSLWSDFSVRATDLEESIDKFGVYYKTAIQLLKHGKENINDCYLLIINKSNESQSIVVKLNKDKLSKVVENLSVECNNLIKVIETEDNSPSEPQVVDLNK